MTEFADTIKEMVSCQQFAEFMGLTINRSGFAVCPFHGDTDASLKIYKNGRGWCCFGCHKGGDVINMASLYYKLPFNETVKRMNDDFGLGLPLECPTNAPERLLLAVERAKRRTARLKEERLKTAKECEYWRLVDALIANERTIEAKRPTEADAALDAEFVSAVKQRDAIRFELEIAEERRCAMYGHKRCG